MGPPRRGCRMGSAYPPTVTRMERCCTSFPLRSVVPPGGLLLAALGAENAGGLGRRRHRGPGRPRDVQPRPARPLRRGARGSAGGIAAHRPGRAGTRPCTRLPARHREGVVELGVLIGESEEASSAGRGRSLLPARDRASPWARRPRPRDLGDRAGTSRRPSPGEPRLALPAPRSTPRDGNGRDVGPGIYRLEPTLLSRARSRGCHRPTAVGSRSRTCENSIEDDGPGHPRASRCSPRPFRGPSRPSRPPWAPLPEPAEHSAISRQRSAISEERAEGRPSPI